MSLSPTLSSSNFRQVEIVVLVHLHRGNKVLSFAFGKCAFKPSALLLTQIGLFLGEICEGCARVRPSPAYCRQMALDELARIAYKRIKRNISASNIVTELFSSFTAS